VRLGERLRLGLAGRLRPSSPEARNERALYGEAIFQSISNAGALSFVSVFLVRLGAPSWLVGVYTSIPALMMILFALPGATYVQRQRSLVATVNRTRLLFRTGIGSLALLPFLPGQVAAYALTAVRGLTAIPDAALVVAETTLYGQMATPKRRTRMLSTRSAILGLFSAAVGFLAGQWLDATPFPLNYQLLFATAFLSGLGSVWALSHIRLSETASEMARRKPRLRLAEMVPLIRGAPSFARFLGAAFLFRLGMSLPSAVYPIFRVRVLGASDAWIGILFTLERGLSVISYLVLSRLVARERIRRWLWLGCVGMAFYPLTMSLARTPEMLLLPEVIIGLVSPAMNLFLTDTLLRVSPEDGRPAFVAANSLLSSLTGFAMPMLGTVLGDTLGIGVALWTAASLRFVGGLAFWALRVSAHGLEGQEDE
jgi:hypothetical protein